MTANQYLDRLLVRYSGMFDIYQPYRIRDTEYPAYGYFFSHNEKYVLVREANLWAADSYEHMLFLTSQEITDVDIDKADQLIREYMEPVFVRQGEELPPKNHMYSFLTIVMICEQKPSEEVIKRIRRYKFDKGYQFNLRGYCNGRLILADMESERVITNFAARKSKKTFLDTFDDVKEGKITFSELCQKHEITPFTQDMEVERKHNSRSKADSLY